MAHIPILPADLKSREMYLSSRTLPVNYMGDYSLMAFVVDRCEEACALLLAEGYRMRQHQYGTVITIEGPAEILEINLLLTSKEINCTFSDIADTLYQA